MQSVLLSKNDLLTKLRILLLLFAPFVVGCAENGLPSGYEESIDLNRKPTAAELDSLRTETVKEMCKDGSEYRDLKEAEKECLVAYSSFFGSCKAALVSIIPEKVSTTAFVDYSLEYADCLHDRRIREND